MRHSIGLALLALGGCASHTGVVSMGQDTFMIAKQAATGLPGLGNLKAELIAEGAAHCRRDGLEFQIVRTRKSSSCASRPEIETSAALACSAARTP